jgi:hypothetical protein
MNFQELYHSLMDTFRIDNLFVEINGTEDKIVWPKGSGVYVIWKNNIKENNNLIYVGLTGKFKRNGNGDVVFNGGSFRFRANRWTPYRFCESERDTNWKYSFRYGPLSSNLNEQERIKYDDNAYANSILYKDLLIHCFIVNADHPEYSPVLLESMILTKYLKESDNNLPPANNSL